MSENTVPTTITIESDSDSQNQTPSQTASAAQDVTSSKGPTLPTRKPYEASERTLRKILQQFPWVKFTGTKLQCTICDKAFPGKVDPFRVKTCAPSEHAGSKTHQDALEVLGGHALPAPPSRLQQLAIQTAFQLQEKVSPGFPWLYVAIFLRHDF